MAIVGALPIQLANGTLADATQVMSDFNYVVAQVNANAAGLTGGNAFTGTQTIAGDTITTNAAVQTLSNKTLATSTIITGPVRASVGNVTVFGALASSAINIDNFDAGGALSQIGFGYTNSGVNTNATAAIAYVATSGVGNGLGDLVFGTRSVTTDSAPGVQMRIDSTGMVGLGIGGVTTALTRLTVGGTTGTSTDSIAYLSAINSADQLRVNFNNSGAAIIGIGADAAGSFIIGKSASTLGTSPTKFLTITQAGVVTANLGAVVAGGLTVTGGLSMSGGLSTDTLSITAGAIITGNGVNTPVGVTNVQAVVAGNQQWMRVGNIVTVSGALQIDPTSASSAVVVALAFPVASTITAGDQVGGTASGVGATVNMGARVIGDTAGHRAFISYVADTNTGNANWSYQYTYIVI
jgi:hypothetical protein